MLTSWWYVRNNTNFWGYNIRNTYNVWRARPSWLSFSTVYTKCLNMSVHIHAHLLYFVIEIVTKWCGKSLLFESFSATWNVHCSLLTLRRALTKRRHFSQWQQVLLIVCAERELHTLNYWLFESVTQARILAGQCVSVSSEKFDSPKLISIFIAGQRFTWESVTWDMRDSHPLNLTLHLLWLQSVTSTANMFKLSIKG